MSSACTPFDREPDDPSLTLGVPGCGAPPRLQPGMTLGRYIVLDALGVGGMGEVVSAYDPDLDRKVALKVLRRSTRRRLGDEGRSRMLHEARAIASLCDRNVLPVYHVGEFEDELFLVMKLVAGVPLGRHCRGRPWQEVLPLLIAAGRGLAAAHRAGLVHRDVKPSNVMVDSDGEVYVMDFGLARVDGHGSIIPALPDSDEIDLGTLRGPPLGEHGKIVGTPVYMAPEQHEGVEADARADQFSFCIVAWELLLGVFPFDAGAPGGLLAAKRAGPTRGVHVRVVPRRIERALLRGLAGRPEDRHPSMEALLGALQGDAGRGRMRMAVLATVVLGSAALAWAWPRAQPCASGEERIARVWDDARREQLGASFLAHDADELGARVIATIDEQADRWASAYDDTCAARSSGDEAQADARMACLGQRAVELGALVEVLGHADTNTATHALPAVHAWSSAGLCEPGDARSQAPAAERESAELTARARALVQAGRYLDAIEAADDAVALAHRRDDVHARCEALIVQGDALIRGGNADRGAASFEQAVQEAAGAGVDEVAARAATRLMRYFAIAHRIDDAMLWSRHAEGALRRLGDPARLRADWLDALGIARGNAGDYPASLSAFEQALALHREQSDEETLETAALRNGLAVTLDSLGRWAEAERQFAASVAISIRLLGERHPSVALRLMNLGQIELQLRRPDEAREHFTRALELSALTLEPAHPQHGVGHRGLAEAELARGDTDAALGHARSALELIESAYGPDDARSARSHLVLARVALAQGRNADALAEARSGLATLDAASGPQHVDTAFAHDLLGDVLLELGRTREAHEHHSIALAGVEPALGADHHDLAHVLEGLARSALANDLPGEAMAAATRALVIVEREGVVHLELAHTLALLAVIERGHGRPAQAAAHAARARALVDLLRERASDAARFDADPIARWIRAVDANANPAVNPAVGGAPPQRVFPVTPPVQPPVQH